MGTRHLITCIVDKKVKISQYGQWDGYPTGAGNAIAEWITEEITFEPRKCIFINNLKTCSFVEQDYVEKRQKNLKMSDSEFYLRFPEYNSDTSTKLLDILTRSEGVKLQLINSYEFRKNTVSCEFHYKLDFDKETLTIYRGSTKAWKRFKFSQISKKMFKRD